MRLEDLLRALKGVLSAPIKGRVVGVETSYREEIVPGPDGKPQKNTLKVTHEMSEKDARQFLEENRRRMDAMIGDPEALLRRLQEGQSPRPRRF